MSAARGRFAELIARSSLGTPEALAARETADPDRVAAIVALSLIHVRAIAPEQYEADCPTCGNTTPVVSDARTARQAASIHCMKEERDA
jgi:hypothetical protein